VTYICCSTKKKVVTYSILFLFLFFVNFFNALFGRFVTSNKGSSKTRKNFVWKKSIWAHHKKCGVFFLRFFSPPSRGCLVRFFYCAFGRVVTRGVKKCDKKIARKSPQLPKKALTHLRHFFFFSRRPLGRGLGRGTQKARTEWRSSAGALLSISPPRVFGLLTFLALGEVENLSPYVLTTSMDFEKPGICRFYMAAK
jgi:hypothetical protein